MGITGRKNCIFGKQFLSKSSEDEMMTKFLKRVVACCLAMGMTIPVLGGCFSKKGVDSAYQVDEKTLLTAAATPTGWAV